MTATITDHAALLRELSEEAHWVLRQLRESAPDGQVVAAEVSAPLGLVARFAGEVAALVETGRTYQPVDTLPDPAPMPQTFTFYADGLARHNTRIFADAFDRGRRHAAALPDAGI